MSTSLYQLQSRLNAGGDRVTLSDPRSRLSAFFIWGSGDGEFLKHRRQQAVAQDGITAVNLLAADYVESTIDVPIFSVVARDLLLRPLAGEVEFFDIEIRCDGEIVPACLARLCRNLPLVDIANSDFRTLVGPGDPVLVRAKYQANDADFMIARDNKYRERYVCSQKFVDLCRSLSLHIDFVAPI